MSRETPEGLRKVCSYFAFGVPIHTNLPIPGLLARGSSSGVSSASPLSVVLGALPPGVVPRARGPILFESDTFEQGSPSLTVLELEAGGGTLFRYADGTTFVIDRGGSHVWATWPPHMSLDDTATYLLGPVMAFVLRARGVLSLHAGVVELGGGAVAVVGGPEAGKSTVLAALALRGSRVLGDDLAPVYDEGGRLCIHPSYPRVRLWNDSVERLFGSAEALPLLTPTWDKRYLDVHERGLFEDRPLPLSAIFVLDDRVASEEAPRVQTLSRREAFAVVLTHLHTVWMLPASPQDAVFRLATRIAREVPVARVTPHSDPARLSSLCDLIVSQAERLGAPAFSAASGRGGGGAVVQPL